MSPVSNTKTVRVLSQYSLLHRIAPNDALPDLKPQIAALCGSRIRRVDRYIELCVLGALNCVQGQTLPNHTAVYLATRCGAVHTPSLAMTSIFQSRQSPKPLHFVNTLGNTACFYLTRGLEINGQTQVLSQEALSFEAALLQAVLDIEAGVVKTALVGGIDEVTLPVDQQARRLGASGADTLLEGSHWLLLAAESVPASASTRLASPQYLSDMDELVTWLGGQPAADVQLSFQPTATEQQALISIGRTLIEASAVTRFDAVEHGVYSGHALLDALADLQTRPVIHLGRSDDIYCAVLLLP